MAKKIRINPGIPQERVGNWNPWTKEEDDKLLYLYSRENLSINGLCIVFKKSKGSIRSRLKFLLGNLKKDSELQGDDDILLEELKECRLEIAREKKWSPAYIITNEVLYRIVKKKPHTKEEMLLIKGVGEQSFKNYGEQFLKILNSFS